MLIVILRIVFKLGSSLEQGHSGKECLSGGGVYRKEPRGAEEGSGSRRTPNPIPVWPQELTNLRVLVAS